jgi:hypothetical protein
VIRFLAVIVGIAASLAGAYGAFDVMRNVGPADRTNEFGYGDAAKEPPGGGNLFQSRNFARVKQALERELGADGLLESLNIREFDASALAQVDGKRVYVDIDASGRSRSRVDDDPAEPSAVMPVSKLQPEPLDGIVAEATETAGVGVESIYLSPSSRDWRVQMLDGGEPDSFIVNLDGSGLRLSGEPNPAPVGEWPDSLLRAENLERVLAAAAAAAGADAGVIDVDIRPDRVSLDLDQNGRELSLDYGYDAVLTNRDLRARSREPVIKLSDIDPQAPERMARAAREKVKSKGLADAQYVLLNASGFHDEPVLMLYLRQDFDPPYVVADLHGRKLTWPGRGQ